MLRITEHLENDNAVRLRLDGTVNLLSLPEIEAMCSRHRKHHGKVIVLDLAGVDFMSAEVAQKMVQLRNQQLKIINCSPFIETLLKTVEP